MEFNESEFLIETEVPTDELIISRTDLSGVIILCSKIFGRPYRTKSSGAVW